MNKKTIWWIIAIVIVIGIVIVSRPNKQPTTDIKIGAVLASTGIGSSWAEVAREAIDMAVTEINQSGGVNGRKVQVIYGDSQTDPAKAVSSFQKLVSVDHVDAAVGDVWAFLTNPLVPISTDAKTLIISPTVMDTSVEKPGPYFFSLGHQMSGIEPAINKFFDQYPNAKTASLVCWGVDPWGLTFTAEYEKVAAQRNVKIVMKTCTNDFTPDYRTEAAKVKSAKADVVLVDGLGDRAIAQFRTFGITSPIVADSNTIAGYEVGGTVSTEQLKDAYIIDWHASDGFIKKFEAQYGHYPILEAQNSYEAVRSIAKALENDPNDVLAGLKKVRYDSVDGANGKIDFTTGTNINPNKTPASLYKVHGKGDYEVVQ